MNVPPTLPSWPGIAPADEPCGLKVASTFSGGGGSCAGYKLAGFEVVWANEWNEHARSCYSMNHPTTVLDARSVLEVTSEEILSTTGLAVGELDVFDGSPPCQTFSSAGRRDMSDARTDLFEEWLRLLAGMKPRAFIAENVAGMARGKAKGVYIRTLAKMRSCGYRAEARLLDAQWLQAT